MGECMHVIYNVRLTVGTNVERISYKDTISFRFKMYMVYLDVFHVISTLNYFIGCLCMTYRMQKTIQYSIYLFIFFALANINL